MRHKRVYSLPTDREEVYRIIMIVRFPKPKKLIRKIMYIAWFDKHKK